MIGIEDDFKMTALNKGSKRKISIDNYIDTRDAVCCRRISYFACLCGVVSLLLQAYNYVDSVEINNVLDIDDSKVKSVIDMKLEEKIDAYLREVTGTSHRHKRDAMLVSRLCVLSVLGILSQKKR